MTEHPPIESKLPPGRPGPLRFEFRADALWVGVGAAIVLLGAEVVLFSIAWRAAVGIWIAGLLFELFALSELIIPGSAGLRSRYYEPLPSRFAAASQGRRGWLASSERARGFSILLPVLASLLLLTFLERPIQF